MEKKRKVHFALHPRFDILFTIGDDNYLRIFNTKTHRWRYNINLGITPTAIAIHPVTGSTLMIGFANGYIYQYDSNIEKNK